MRFAQVSLLNRVQASAPPVVSSPLALDFKNGTYSVSGTSYGALSSVPGYAYTRSGAKGEVKSSDGTVSRFAANAPAVIAGDGMFVRPAFTNLLTYSQQFDAANWTGVSVTRTADQLTAPDQSVAADKLAATASSTSYVNQSFSTTIGSAHTIGCFMHAGTATFGWLSIGSGANGIVSYYDLTNGTASAVATSAGAGYTGTSSSIRTLGNGWYFCTITFTASSNSTVLYVGPSDTGSASAVTSGKTLYLWEAQAVLGTRAGPVITTSAATATVGADALSVTLANGTYSAVYTFDDASTQTISTTISGGAFTMPTTLNRPLVQKVTLV